MLNSSDDTSIDKSLLFTTLRRRTKLDKVQEIKDNLNENKESYFNELTDILSGNNHLNNLLKNVIVRFESLNNDKR
jgi:hypothetical protein